MANRFLASDKKLLESGLFADMQVKCKERIWNLHKNILCSRSVWFDKALNGNFKESKTGVVEITNFEPEQVDWLIKYIYTGVCDIASLRPDRQSQFLTCIEVYTVSDYFNLEDMAQIALGTLKQDLDSKIGPTQLTYEPITFMDDLLEAIEVVYQDIPATDTDTTAGSGNGLRRAFVEFAFAARFFFLNNPEFSSFLDATPVFALDLFRAMRNAADFTALQPEPHCSYCRNKPTRTDKGYYTHVTPEKLRLVACCSNCASKKEFLPPTEDWASKNTRAVDQHGSS